MNKYGKYSITVSDVESWDKIQKQQKYMLLKDLFPGILNHINTLIDHGNLYMTLLVSKKMRRII